MALLVPENAARTSFAGYVRVGSDEYKVRVCGIEYTTDQKRMLFVNAQVVAEPFLATLLCDHEAILKVRLLQSSTLESFVRQLEELLTVLAPPKSVQTSLPNAEYYTQLMEEIDAIGWSRVVYLSDDLRLLELATQDVAQRTHNIRIMLPADYPQSAPTCAVDAPEPFNLSWSVVASSVNKRGLTAKPTLKTILEQFHAFLSEYQAFWNVLDEIDSTCCVLEPQHPTRATGRRRLAVQKHVSIQVQVNPEQSRGVCDVRFYGNESSIAPLRERWSEHLFQWTEELSVPDNLERLLEIELPSPRVTKTDEFALECGICYCYRLEMEVDEPTEGAQDGSGAERHVETSIPDRLCENVKCNRPFHEKCLFEWLKALPTARQSFNTVFGECPYCREAISAKVLTS
ncbi:hypothetical protein Poli38472_009635 [Pythium oligandrum]|uniref:RING-type domain-containing protein n=1 Tax=Pythium oligandrum TaxID=41045 RepID=A0A8K1CHB5_PYTOL|nr:hypothetical protein Poli38472_009635 [Pythium oligandrum]|eukprot:TMW62142.1 hypothetical protein Poli38472_009635 [Pythium oligandrum]